MFQLQVKQESRWLVVDSSDSREALLARKDSTVPGEEEIQIVEVGTPRDKTEVLVAMQENAADIARLSARLSESLQRSKSSFSARADTDVEMCQLHDQLNSLRSNLQRTVDNFFHWLNTSIAR